MKQIAQWRPARLLPIVVATLVGGVIGTGIDHLAFAQPAGIKRTILFRADDPAGPAYEAVVGVAEIAPGASAGRHRHHGIEVGYVLEGTVTVEPEGRPSATYTAGQAFKNEAGIHNARNPGNTPVKIFAVYIVEKGKPLAESVP
jgi:quercetin dioxygenase-like cupin family protein